MVSGPTHVKEKGLMSVGLLRGPSGSPGVSLDAGVFFPIQKLRG